MPKIKINGKEIEFEKGMTVLQACELADIEIPRFERDGIQPIYYQRVDGSFYLDADGQRIQAKGPITQFKQAMGLGISLNF